MDGMTIDEVIKYFDDDAKENAKLAIIYRGNDDDLAEMHKQDANRSAYVSVWLRELKMYREDTRFADLYERICIKRDEDRDYFARTKDQTYITRIAEKEMFIHMMQDMMFDRYGVEEVNADDSNGTN